MSTDGKGSDGFRWNGAKKWNTGGLDNAAI